MTRLGRTLIALFLALASPSVAADRLVVVELYTSQGCSSCPPADALLGEIAYRDDILALALHVDYWDYIGWKDIFADPDYTARQKSYARFNQHQSVYTPQMVVGGRDFIIGHKPMKLADAIAAHKAQSPQAQISATRRGGTVDLVVSDVARPAAIVVTVVTYDHEETVRIRRGENAGRTIDYHNIVTGWVPVGEWDGRGEFRKSLRMSGNQNVAVIVQERGPGAILAAAKLN